MIGALSVLGPIVALIGVHSDAREFWVGHHAIAEIGSVLSERRSIDNKAPEMGQVHVPIEAFRRKRDRDSGVHHSINLLHHYVSEITPRLKPHGCDCDHMCRASSGIREWNLHQIFRPTVMIRVGIGIRASERRYEARSLRIFERLIGNSALLGRSPREASGEEGSYEREEADNGARQNHARLAVGEIGYRFPRVRSASLLDEVIALEAMLLGGLFTALALIRGFSYGEPRKRAWFAASAACLIWSALWFASLISGKIWIPWS